jgi:predicted nucleotidyltransferase component of viral defense system
VKYASAQSFRQALNDRLASLARAQGTERSRLQRWVAFERFLGRVYQQAGERLILKGGYALEQRLGGRARATLDLDFAAVLLSRAELLETLQKAAELDLGDFFRYTVAAARPPELVGRPEGGLRFRVEAHLDRTQPFATFVLDVGMGDVRINPTEYLESSVDLSFAELPPVRFPVIPLLEHFAEKLHAYTRPRTARTRVLRIWWTCCC